MSTLLTHVIITYVGSYPFPKTQSHSRFFLSIYLPFSLSPTPSLYLSISLSSLAHAHTPQDLAAFFRGIVSRGGGRRKVASLCAAGKPRAPASTAGGEEEEGGEEDEGVEVGEVEVEEGEGKPAAEAPVVISPAVAAAASLKVLLYITVMVCCHASYPCGCYLLLLPSVCRPAVFHLCV